MPTSTHTLKVILYAKYCITKIFYIILDIIYFSKIVNSKLLTYFYLYYYFNKKISDIKYYYIN